MDDKKRKRENGPSSIKSEVLDMQLIKRARVKNGLDKVEKLKEDSNPVFSSETEPSQDSGNFWLIPLRVFVNTVI